MTLLWKTYIFGSTFGPIFFLKSTKESMKKAIASSACQKSIFDRFWNHFGRGQGVQRTSLFPTHAAFPPRRLIENEVFFPALTLSHILAPWVSHASCPPKLVQKWFQHGPKILPKPILTTPPFHMSRKYDFG